MLRDGVTEELGDELHEELGVPEGDSLKLLVTVGDSVLVSVSVIVSVMVAVDESELVIVSVSVVVTLPDAVELPDDELDSDKEVVDVGSCVKDDVELLELLWEKVVVGDAVALGLKL